MERFSEKFPLICKNKLITKCSLPRPTGRCATPPPFAASLLPKNKIKIDYFQKQNASLLARTLAARGVYFSTGPPSPPRPTHRTLLCCAGAVNQWIGDEGGALLSYTHLHTTVYNCLYINISRPNNWKYKYDLTDTSLFYSCSIVASQLSNH